MENPIISQEEIIAVWNKKKHLIAYYSGIAIVFFTHLFMIFSSSSMKIHAFINIIASFLIAYYFVDKEFGDNNSSAVY